MPSGTASGADIVLVSVCFVPGLWGFVPTKHALCANDTRGRTSAVAPASPHRRQIQPGRRCQECSAEFSPQHRFGRALAAIGSTILVGHARHMVLHRHLTSIANRNMQDNQMNRRTLP
jgi:hypothetical protein